MQFFHRAKRLNLLAVQKFGVHYESPLTAEAWCELCCRTSTTAHLSASIDRTCHLDQPKKIQPKEMETNWLKNNAMEAACHLELDIVGRRLLL